MKLETWKQTGKSTVTLTGLLAEKESEGTPIQEQLPEETKILRTRLLKACLKSGSPFKTIMDGPVGLLIEELSQWSLGNHSDVVCLYLKLLIEEENWLLKDELYGAEGTDPLGELKIFLSVYFDSTPDPLTDGKRFATVVRYVCENDPDGPKIVQSLIGLDFLNEYLDVPKLASLVRQKLTENRMDGANAATIVPDSCVTNVAAHEELIGDRTAKWAPLLILCFLHMINNTGNQVQLPFLDSFCCYVRQLFPRLLDAKRILTVETGENIDTGVDHWWWYKCDVDDYMLHHWGNLGTAFQKIVDSGCTANNAVKLGEFLAAKKMHKTCI